MNIDVSAGQLLGGLIAVFVLIVATIQIFKRRYATKDYNTLISEVDPNNPLVARNKYPGVDSFRHSNSFFFGGLVLSLLLVILAFNWTKEDPVVFIPEGALEMEEDFMQAPPPTTAPPPPPPPPPPPVIEEVPEELIEEEVTFEDNSITEETPIEAPPAPVEKAAPPPPPPPPPPAPVTDEIFKVVEDQPRFPGCEDKGSNKDELKKCAEAKMLEFIYANIKYPAIARENGVEGTAVVTFVVEKDGSITDVRVARDPGAGTGDEALRVVKTFPKWIPGKQRGNPVRVQFNLPVKFKLQ